MPEYCAQFPQPLCRPNAHAICSCMEDIHVRILYCLCILFCQIYIAVYGEKVRDVINETNGLYLLCAQKCRQGRVRNRSQCHKSQMYSYKRYVWPIYSALCLECKDIKVATKSVKKETIFTLFGGRRSFCLDIIRHTRGVVPCAVLSSLGMFRKFMRLQQSCKDVIIWVNVCRCVGES